MTISYLKILMVCCVMALFAAKEGRANAPILSSQAQVSVITCGPGQELYEAFGHSAIRVKDPAGGFDLVFNYGVFDFNQENFYLNFARGFMRYSLGVSQMNDFLMQYQRYGRSVREQVLNLDSADKQQLINFLDENLKPENREYYYDYFYNNCSTKIIEVLQKALGANLILHSPNLDGSISFRGLIHQYTEYQPWGRLGIDLGLGLPIDRPILGKNYQFLPDGVEQELFRAEILKSQIAVPLVLQVNNLYTSQDVFGQGSYFSSPYFIFSLLLLITLLAYAYGRNGRFFQIWGSFLFFIAGALGFVIASIWLFTNHKAAAWNFNLLWANPLFLFGWFRFSFGLAEKFSSWVFYYLSLVLAGWFLWPQRLDPVLIPFVLSLIIVSFHSARFRLHVANHNL